MQISCIITGVSFVQGGRGVSPRWQRRRIAETNGMQSADGKGQNLKAFIAFCMTQEFRVQSLPNLIFEWLFQCKCGLSQTPNWCGGLRKGRRRVRGGRGVPFGCINRCTLHNRWVVRESIVHQIDAFRPLMQVSGNREKCENGNGRGRGGEVGEIYS